MPVEVERGAYRLADPGVTTESHESTRTVTVQQSYGPLRSIGSPLLLLVSTVALFGLVRARRKETLALSQTERELLAYQDDRADYDEWITQMELPDEYLTPPRAKATSLEALVNYAIDSDEGVVEDPNRDLFAVLTDERCHVYEPPALATDPGPEDDDTSTQSRDTEAETAQDDGSPPGDAVIDGASPEGIDSEPGSNGSDTQDAEGQ